MPVIPLQTAPGPDGIFSIPEEDLRHLTKVRRLKPGDPFKVILPDGKKANAKLWEDNGQWLGKITRILAHSSAPPLPCWLGLGMVRWRQMEWVAEKTSELGLNRWTPLYCHRGKYSKKVPVSNKKLVRLEKIARETIKQCERPSAPLIDPPKLLNEWLLSLKGQEGRKIFFDELSTSPRFGSEFILPIDNFYFFLIGPEGGFSPEERDLILKNSFEAVSLGPQKLKTETAALYVLSVLDATLNT